MRYVVALVIGLAVLAGCGGQPAATPRATVTVTQTVTATPRPSIAVPRVDTLPSRQDPNLRLILKVHTDGCGVIRTEAPAGTLRNLGWSVRDADGFQVLQRNAEGENRYRYYRSGTYRVVLTAWGDATGGYVPVSNEVTIHC